MTTLATILTTVALSAVALGTAPTPAPDAGTVTVFSENVSNLVTAETAPTSERLATLHTHDVLTLVSPSPTTGAWGDFYNVVLPDGRTGWVSANAVIPTPTVTLDDLTETSVIVAPGAGGGWLGQLAAGSSAAFVYPVVGADKIAVPEVGTVLDCAPDEINGRAGLLGDVPMRPCKINAQVGFIRAEHIAPMADLDEMVFAGTATAAAETPIYAAPAATKETEPLAILAEGTRVEVGTPTGAFTPVRFNGETGWAPTKVLMGYETWTDKAKAAGVKAWGKTKEVASDAKDAVTDKLDETDLKKPAVVSQVADVPALILSAVLALLTLAMAWVRKLWAFPIPRLARRALNVVAVVPLVALAATAPIASYGFMLWVVLAVAVAVAAGVLNGFNPDLKGTPAVARTRKAQIIAGVAVVGGAFTGAIVTGFAGWLAPLVTAVVALAAAAGYMLSAPEKDASATVAAPIGETLPEVEEETA